MIQSSDQFRFIRFPELQEILGGVSRAKIERDVAAGRLPAPFKLGKRLVAWKSDEIGDYLNSLQRVAENTYKVHARREAL